LIELSCKTRFERLWACIERRLLFFVGDSDPPLILSIQESLAWKQCFKGLRRADQELHFALFWTILLRPQCFDSDRRQPFASNNELSRTGNRELGIISIHQTKEAEKKKTLCIFGLPFGVTFTIIGVRLSDSFIPLEIMAFRTRLLAPTTIELSGISSNRSTAEEATRGPNEDGF
jgi:hypothetical protein